LNERNKESMAERVRQPGHWRRTWVLLCVLLLPAALTAQEQAATLNFKDVDIQAVIDYVSRETGTNFIVDPRVQGRVTLVSGRPLARDEIYDVFLALLRVHGFAAVPGEGAVKLVPDAVAKQAEVPTVGDEDRPGADAYVTRVVTLENVQAVQLVPILRPLIPQSGHLAASPVSNSLVVSDNAANVQRVVDIARRIDRDNSESMEVIALRHANAAEVVQTLQAMDPAGREGPARARAVADERSNSVILAGDPRRRAELRQVIRQLDLQVSIGNTDVVYLRHAGAVEVAEVLQGMLNAAATGSAGTASASATGAAPLGGGTAVPVQVQAHQSTNSLVLQGPAEQLQDLRKVIGKLDVRRAQVLVEAVIAEVSSETANQLGVQWGIRSGDNAVGTINFNRSGAGIYNLGAGISAFLDGDIAAPPSIPDGALIAGAIDIGSTTIAVLIQALSADAANNILSTPTLLTMDNAEAEIIVGQNVPFITGRSIEQSGQAFDTIERQDVGVKLRVLPQINEGGAVKLEVEQEVSQIAPVTGSGAADLITNKRSLRTSVMVEDGELVVLGGLLDDVLVQTRDKVPGLGDLPVLGALFRYESARKEKRNLMIFLRPVIVRDSETQRRITEPRYRDMRAAQEQSRGREPLLMAPEAVPVMTAWEELVRLPPPFEAGDGLPADGIAAPPGSAGVRGD
jgi:general secretion pathway protein D